MFDWILKNRSHCYVLFLIVILFACETKETKETVEFTEISMPTIVNDLVGGGLLYEDKHIKIRAKIEEITPRGSIKLHTHHQRIFFHTYTIENPEILKQYEVGKSYTFKLHVYGISHITVPGTPLHISIHAKILE